MGNWLLSSNPMLRKSFHLLLIASLMAPSLPTQAAPIDSNHPRFDMDNQALSLAGLSYLHVPLKNIPYGTLGNPLGLEQPMRNLLYVPALSWWKRVLIEPLATLVLLMGIGLNPQRISAQDQNPLSESDLKAARDAIGKWQANPNNLSPVDGLVRLRLNDDAVKQSLLDWLLLKWSTATGPTAASLRRVLDAQREPRLLLKTMEETAHKEVIAAGLIQYAQLVNRYLANGKAWIFQTTRLICSSRRLRTRKRRR